MRYILAVALRLVVALVSIPAILIVALVVVLIVVLIVVSGSDSLLVF